jgi:hypothetical protein
MKVRSTRSRSCESSTVGGSSLTFSRRLASQSHDLTRTYRPGASSIGVSTPPPRRETPVSQPRRRSSRLLGLRAIGPSDHPKQDPDDRSKNAAGPKNAPQGIQISERKSDALKALIQRKYE